MTTLACNGIAVHGMGLAEVMRCFDYLMAAYDFQVQEWGRPITVTIAPQDWWIAVGENRGR